MRCNNCSRLLSMVLDLEKLQGLFKSIKVADLTKNILAALLRMCNLLYDFCHNSIKSEALSLIIGICYVLVSTCWRLKYPGCF